MTAPTKFVAVNEVADAKKARQARQAFYTPEALVKRLVEWADVSPSMRVLEPSAGDGRIVHYLLESGASSVDACEVDAAMRSRLADVGANLVGEDFLKYRPEHAYDLIVMNPPFKGKTCDKHIEHAWSMLAPGGKLLSIAPPATGDRLNELALKLPGCQHATHENLGPEWFTEYGTNIAVIVVELRREPTAPQDDVEGFSNWPTYNAAISISSDRKAYESRAPIDAGSLKAAWSKEIGESGGSVYGIDWKEVADYLTEIWPPTESGAINLGIRWESLFGEKGDVFTFSERRQRWASWLKLARRSEDGKDQAKFWHDHGECGKCIHKRGGWCKLAGLPVTVNPYLTFRKNMIGFACQGAGFDDGTPKESEIPVVSPGEQGVLWRESRGLS